MIKLREPDLDPKVLDQLEELIFAHPAYGELCKERFGHLGSLKGARALDIGCGEGYTSVYLAVNGAEVHGIDKRSGAIDRANELARSHGVSDHCSFRTGLVESIDAPDNSFDIVHSQGVLQYTDRARVIEEIHRVLKPGGLLILIENMPNHPVILLVRVIRRIVADDGADKAYLESIKGYFNYQEARALIAQLDDGDWRCRHLTSLATFFWLRLQFLPNLAPVYWIDSGLKSFDRMLLSMVPWLNRFVWIGSVSGRKKQIPGDTP